ncbi:1-deoxy-D-xylulose-5-phosphate synthase [Kitasatospora sp. NPDC088134]|uniref:1-deoxy-D-xylulose-5-phosphate synthase n=1 Tax=Kitasatospora sp. NPDC088134 TaxID=3364071 RepID=UPI003809D74A
MTLAAEPGSTRYGLLRGLAHPRGLRDLTGVQLAALAREIRAFLVDRVCASGGHLGPNLGVVELSLALHRVFDSPADTVLFDTGHQAYVHKLLTGRMAGFDRLRQADGLSGYPSRAESEHDVVENSHASTALSYADGLAKARHLAGERHRAVVAVIGDGALTGGMAWEAMNNLGAAPDRPVVVVLNDNGRSYARTVGSLAGHLRELRTDGRAAGRAGAAGELPPGRSLFETLGFAYLGPVDGHDLPALEEALSAARGLARPVVVHAVTVKGRGYGPARADTAEHMHAVGALDPATGRALDPPGPPTWTEVFGREVCRLGAAHPALVAVTAAMPGPTGLSGFAERFPDRFFDVGIAEQHAVASAAGLALGGRHPLVAVYATFLGRAFDQVLMDVALHRLPVTFVLDRAGVTGPDGPSHHGMWDLALLGAVPGLRVAVPRDAAGLRELLAEAVGDDGGPTALRFPKAPARPGVPARERIGPVDVLYTGRGRDVLLVGAGPPAAEAVAAARVLAGHGIGVTVCDPRWALPVPGELVELAARHRLVVTVEDGVRHGGFGSAVLSALAALDRPPRVRVLGLPRAFLPHGTRDALLAAHGLTAPGIVREVLQALGAPARHAGRG